jgi:CheY-like chemotaxis protein
MLMLAFQLSRSGREMLMPPLKSDPVVPLFHPTSILLVDDDQQFLRALRLALGDGFDCLTFASAFEAINFIQAEQAWLSELLAPPASGTEAEAMMEHIKDPAERLLHVKMSRLPRLFADRSRFGRASVLVGDKRMPGMGCLDTLEQLRGQPLRKLLLSAALEDGTANRALEAGLIDACFSKDHPAIRDTLAAHLRDLQFGYFRQLTQPFAAALHSPDTRFLQHRCFAAVFADFVVKQRIIEHCVLMHPPGILGLDEDGNPAILLVADEDYRQASFEIAEAEGAPVALLSQLINPRNLAVFPTRSGFYSRQMQGSWEQFVWPSVAVGESGLQSATISEPEVVRRVCGKVASFAEHRKQLLN